MSTARSLVPFRTETNVILGRWTATGPDAPLVRPAAAKNEILPIRWERNRAPASANQRPACRFHQQWPIDVAGGRHLWETRAGSPAVKSEVEAESGRLTPERPNFPCRNAPCLVPGRVNLPPTHCGITGRCGAEREKPLPTGASHAEFRPHLLRAVCWILESRRPPTPPRTSGSPERGSSLAR